MINLENLVATAKVVVNEKNENDGVVCIGDYYDSDYGRNMPQVQLRHYAFFNMFRTGYELEYASD